MIRRLSPQQHLVGSFALLILVGSFVLMLPGMTTHGGISYVDALFTSTSAVCVTGLVVKDTGSDFTRLGQWVLLVLIQLGGLGIMTFSTIFLLILGRRPSMSQDTVLQGAFSHSPMKNLYTVILWVVLFTMMAEVMGAGAYFLHWIHEFPMREALFMSLFHAVSAFCNAGFSLFADSFEKYQSDVLINLNTICLIIIGGIGFLVLLEIYGRRGLNLERNKGPRRPFSLHTRLTVLTTLILILAGALFFFVVEYHDMLQTMSFPDKILISAFQSVTARTAGFNTVDFGALSNATLFFFIILMFIGASPGSCGGGVKTTTTAVFFALVRSRLRGESDTMVMNRTIPKETAARTISVVISAGLVITVMVVILLATQLGGTSHEESRGMFLEYLFEAVSAFGTVGLSMGKTAGLNTVGRLVIIMLMFIGRVGPLTLAFSIRWREIPVQLKYSEENIMIG